MKCPKDHWEWPQTEVKPRSASATQCCRSGPGIQEGQVLISSDLARASSAHRPGSQQQGWLDIGATPEGVPESCGPWVRTDHLRLCIGTIWVSKSTRVRPKKRVGIDPGQGPCWCWTDLDPAHVHRALENSPPSLPHWYLKSPCFSWHSTSLGNDLVSLKTKKTLGTLGNGLNTIYIVKWTWAFGKQEWNDIVLIIFLNKERIPLSPLLK
jgi:hypothetical protein